MSTIIKELSEKIERENEAFNNLTDAEKRVKVAEDCLLRIQSGQLIPETSHIMKALGGIYEGDPIKDRVNNPDAGVECEVCAKGGLFMSYIGRVNKTSYENRGTGYLGDWFHLILAEIFTERQIAYIEYAFEGKQYLHFNSDGNRIYFTPKEQDKAEEFNNSFGNPDTEKFQAGECLISICENIITNNGDFIL